MALEVWSEMQFRQKIYTKDAEVDGKIKILPITKTNFPDFQGVEIYGGGIEIGSIYDYFYPNYRSGDLFIGIIDSNGTPKEKVISYTSSDCPKEVGLDIGGKFLANGFELYNGSTDTISKIYSPENNLLNFDHVTTLMYAKNTPTREFSGSKEQFCIQLDSSNGAVTLRNVPNGVNETIFGGYITLYRPTGMGSSETKFDTLYLDEYENGNRSIGKALTDFEARLDAQGFNSAPFGARTSNNFLFTTNPNGIDGGIDKLVGSIHQSGAITEIIIDKDKTDFTDLVPSDGSESNNYYIRTTQLSNWNGEKFNINRPTARRDDNKGQPWIECYDIMGHIIDKTNPTAPIAVNVIIRVSIHYTNTTGSSGYITFRKVDTDIYPDKNQSFNNSAIVWRTIY